MSADRTDTIAIEFPASGDVLHSERGRGDTYFDIALDLSDDLAEGHYRAVLTLAEARNLHAALGTALAELADAVAASLADLPYQP